MIGSTSLEGLGHLALRLPNWVGDLVMATPVIDAAWRDPRFERVSLLVRAHLAPVLADAPWAEAVVPLGRSSDEPARLADLRPDGIALLGNSFGAAWRARAAGIPIRAGSALSMRRLLLTHAVVPPTRDGRRVPVPTAHLMRDVAGLLGIAIPDVHPRLHLREELAEAQSTELRRLGLGASESYALCCPGAAFGAAKLWPVEHYARALDALHEMHALRPVVSGGPGEEALIERVVELCESPAISLANSPRDLETLKPLVRDAAIVVMGDSGPRWYAAAFDTPCVTVLGPNFPELTASSLEWARVVHLEGLECAPCVERVCPLGHHRCMRELEPAVVIRAAEELLEKRRLEGSTSASELAR